jgi:hypothetical protein
MDLPIRESLGSVVVPDLKAGRTKQQARPTTPTLLPSLLLHVDDLAASREGKDGRVRTGINTRWGVESEAGGMGNESRGQRKRPGVGGARWESGKQGSVGSRALPSCSRPLYHRWGRHTCAGQALASCNGGRHLESRLFASAKAGRGGVARAPGPTVARCPRSPPPCPGRAALIGRRTRSFEGRTDIRTYTGAKRQCTCVALMPLEWTRRFDRSGVSSSSVFPHERAGRPAGYSVFFSFATQRAGPWPGSIFPGTVEPRA